MIKTIRKSKMTIISLLLVIVCGFLYCGTSFLQTKQYNTNNQAIVRTVEINKNAVDYQSILDEFEDAELETKGTLTTFVGYKSLDLTELDGFDLVSDADIEDTKVSIKYNFSYDNETNIVTLSAELSDEIGEIQVDTIDGIAFINEFGEIDALMNVDGQYVLLSEMQNAGMIENCGWFSNLFKKIVVAVVVVVAVAAVAAAVVATAGAGLGACIAAGAIAGGLAGGVAGGLISYSEYGKLDWKWIVGGAVIGAALGAVTGWGVGTIMGAGTTPSSQVNSLINTAKNGKLDFSNSIKNKSYFNPGSSDYRSYYECANTISQEIMQARNPIVEAETNFLKWTVEGSAHGTNGVWELVIDPVKKIIVHFLFAT